MTNQTKPAPATETLKPCPFCGVTLVPLSNSFANLFSHPSVPCGCPAESSTVGPGSLVWNTRPQEAQDRETIKAQAEEIKRLQTVILLNTLEKIPASILRALPTLRAEGIAIRARRKESEARQ